MNLQVIINIFAFGAFCMVTSGAWEAELTAFVCNLSNPSKPEKQVVISLKTPTKEAALWASP
jgi:hypothetical protein